MKRWLKWLLGAGAALALAIVSMMAVGALLPVGHVASVSEVVRAQPDAVWAAMTNVESFPAWRPGIDVAERLPERDGLPVWRESGPMGAMTLQVLEWDPPRRMVTRIADEGLPFGGTWTYALAPDPLGTRVTLTERGEVYNVFFRFVSRYVMGHDATMRTYLEGLHARMGSGGGS